MDKINFVNNSTPALSAENLNELQDNVETAINTEISNINNNTSNQEIQIGTWNNKPLYRKIITGTLPSTTRTNKTLDTISDLNEILTLRAVIGYTSPRNQSWGYPFPVITSDTYSSIIVNGNNQIIVRWESNASAWVNSPIVVVIEYTKTTD